jgi:acetylornithine deacetylase/succinyl-diaminopimelate desuccinylase-like protein
MIANLVPRVLEMAISIQQIPAPTFHEARRAAFICERFKSEGLGDVTIDDAGNAYGRLPGKSGAQPLVVSAHLDTVFTEGTPLDLRRETDRIYGPGIGDNSLGVAGLFGLLWALQGRDRKEKTKPPPGDIWLVANVGEEGLGNLRGMSAVVDRFGSSVRAYLILEGMALGQVYHRGLGVLRYQITCRTAGGHSWVDYGQPSAIHELAALIVQLCAIPVSETPRSSMNVGVIFGGTTVNTIASHAECLLDLRSEDAAVLNSLVGQAAALVEAGNRPGVEMNYEVVGQRPAGGLAADHPLVRQAVRSLQAQGISARLNIGSTDANAPLSRGLPAVCVGLTTGGGAHTRGEYIQIEPLALGLSQLVSLVESTFKI